MRSGPLGFMSDEESGPAPTDNDLIGQDAGPADAGPADAGAFLELIAQASLDANRTLRVLERRTQSQDHPILLTVPETLYLKCLIFEVL